MRAWASRRSRGHAGGFVVGRGFELLAVERVDLGADRGVFVGDDSVGDAGVDEGHLHLPVAEQGGDRLEPHAAVDRLGGQGVPQLVRVQAGHSGAFADSRDDAADGVALWVASMVGEEPMIGADVREIDRGPLGEQVDQLRVQRHVAVVAEFAERDAQPVPLIVLR